VSDSSCMSTLPRSDPSSILYHYTSAEGLLGILGSRALWATDIRFLNDSAEFHFFRDILVLHARRRARRLRNEHARRTVERGIDKVASGMIGAYVVSFSEQGNVLSQWRAYAPRDGVSIGFHRAALQEVRDFRLCKCRYLRESAASKSEESILREVATQLDGDIQWASRLVQQMDRRTTDLTSQSDSVHEDGVLVSQGIMWLALQLKHAGFLEEMEWRLIDNRSELDLYQSREAGNDDRRFRRGTFGLTPYLLARLPDSWKSVPLGIAEVIVGPGPNSLAVVAAIEELLESSVRSTARVTHCGIPYRSW